MSQHSVKPPVWFWIVAGLAVVWNIVGVMSYIGFVTIGADEIAAMPEAEQALLNAVPFWATAAFAIAVFAGIAGSVLLLLRKGLATPVFALSLVAVLVQMTRWLVFSDALKVYGGGAAFMPITVIIFAAFLLWFSTMAKGKGWLG